LAGWLREDLVGGNLDTLAGGLESAVFLQRVQHGSESADHNGRELVLKGPDGPRRVNVEWENDPATGRVHVLARPAAPNGTPTGEEMERVLLKAFPGAALILDAAGIVLAANDIAADLLGTRELAGRAVSEFLPPDVAERRRRKFLEVVRTGWPCEFEDEVQGRSFHVSLHPIRDAGGAVARIVSYSKDVTGDKHSAEERRKLTQQLQQAQKMEAIGTLAGGIAHDFNNLLMAIQGNVSLAQLDLEPNDPRHRMLANIEKLIGSGAELTSKLLGYARRGKYESKPLLLNDLVRETSETFGRMRKDISIHRNLADDLRSIIADKGQLEQVLLNLFVNAADAMPGGGHLRLKTRNVTHHDIPAKGYQITPGNYVRLEVQDTGVGMDPDIMARIFDPFFTTKRMGRGTGLGLASAYGIVKGHAGYIEVESEKGAGTTFYIDLPATDLPALTEAQPGRRLESGAGRILLVDDELTVLDVTACMIERLGYTVVKAASGREAVALFRAEPTAFHLVILDMIMPEMRGGEVFDELKRIHPGIKVLLASGYSMQGQAREIMNRGCTGFIQKPFTMEDLSQKLQAVVK
jgi:PAS domain S-box-containing protein